MKSFLLGMVSLNTRTVVQEMIFEKAFSKLHRPGFFFFQCTVKMLNPFTIKA